jgi:hypothetical protein
LKSCNKKNAILLLQVEQSEICIEATKREPCDKQETKREPDNEKKPTPKTKTGTRALTTGLIAKRLCKSNNKHDEL